jgi:hypothetical protein
MRPLQNQSCTLLRWRSRLQSTTPNTTNGSGERIITPAIAKHTSTVVSAHFSLMIPGLLSSPTSGEEVHGHASVKSGNTMLISAQLRLFGVNATKFGLIYQLKDIKLKWDVIAWP